MLIAKFSGQIKHQRYFLGLCLLGLVLLSGCSEHSTDAIPPADQSNEQDTPTAESSVKSEEQGALSTKTDNPALNGFIEEVDRYYQSLQTEADALKDQVTQFVIAPSEKTLHNSILAWEQAHNRYLAGHFLSDLFADLITDETQNLSDQPLLDVHKRLDAHPLLPGYLDSVEGYPFSGLIHTEIPLTLATLYQEFQLGDAAYVTLGFHALEVMLKGTDKEREITEFEALKALQETSKAAPELRRTLYCSLLAEQIQQDIQTLPSEWQQQIKTVLFNLDAEQTQTLKLRLTKTLDRQVTEPADASQKNKKLTDSPEHKNAQALEMEQSLREKLRAALNNDPSS